MITVRLMTGYIGFFCLLKLTTQHLGFWHKLRFSEGLCWMESSKAGIPKVVPHAWFSLFLLGQLLSGMGHLLAPMPERCGEEPLQVKLKFL